jgi:hypothetical protein
VLHYSAGNGLINSEVLHWRGKGVVVECYIGRGQGVEL